MATRPLVSIIIPSFNQGKFIRETIQSCLSQDYRPIEILVVDGGSSDETLQVLRRFDESTPELKWLSEADKGVVDAVNKGLSWARGDILTIQSSDDIFFPGALSATVRTFLRDPELGLVYGNVKYLDENSMVIGQSSLGNFDLAEYLGRFMYIPQPGTCFTRAAMQHAGNWRESVSYAADADFWFRIVTQFPAQQIEYFLGGYRRHPEQRDTQKTHIARDWERSIRDLIGSEILNTRQRRYARMGIHLARYHYTLESQWLKRTLELYLAMFCCPQALPDTRFPKRELLPGRTPIWSYLSRIKRFMGFKPRTSE